MRRDGNDTCLSVSVQTVITWLENWIPPDILSNIKISVGRGMFIFIAYSLAIRLRLCGRNKTYSRLLSNRTNHTANIGSSLTIDYSGFYSCLKCIRPLARVWITFRPTHQFIDTSVKTILGFASKNALLSCPADVSISIWPKGGILTQIRFRPCLIQEVWGNAVRLK